MSKSSSKLVQKLKNNLSARMVVCSVVTSTVSAVLCTILILVGYSNLASSEAPSYQVMFLGLPIYEITKSGDSLVGHAVGTNMPLIGIVCSCVLILVTELMLTLKTRNKKSNTSVDATS